MGACGWFIEGMNVGQGLTVWTRTVAGSTISTRSMSLKFEAPRIFGSLARSRLNFTESALKSSPLWNFTPRLSLISHTWGEISFGSSAASAGTIFKLGSRSTSLL